MINLLSRLAGQSGEPLLTQTTGAAFTDGGKTQESGETFLHLMTEFLGMDVKPGSEDRPKVGLTSTGFDSVDELVPKQSGNETELDLINTSEGKKNISIESKDRLQTKDFPGALLIQPSNFMQMEGEQNRLITTEEKRIEQTKTDLVQFSEDGEVQYEKPVMNVSNLKGLNELIDGLQVEKSGENIVLTIPASNMELTSEKAENIQDQFLKIIRQLSDHHGQNQLKRSNFGMEVKTAINAVADSSQTVPALDSKLPVEIRKESSGAIKMVFSNVSKFMEAGDTPHGKMPEEASNGSQKADIQPTQKFILKEVVRVLSAEIETTAQKNANSKSVLQRLGLETEEPNRLSIQKEESSPLPKESNHQADRKLQTELDLAKKLSDENSKKKSELVNQKSDSQNKEKSSFVRLMDKSPVKPNQSSSATEAKKNEMAFKPLIKIESQNGDVDLEFQSQADQDNGDNEEGKSSMKLNNTSFNQLRKDSGRREFSTQIVKQLQKQADQSGLGAAKNWNQHRFILENGESVNLAVRQSEGIMQLQLGAGSSELNKILHQHINEIREHLQEQMNIDIDLQLQNFGDRQTDSNNNGQNSGNGKQGPNNGAGILSQGAETEAGSPKAGVRYLGFNQNEWTA